MGFIIILGTFFLEKKTFQGGHKIRTNDHYNPRLIVDAMCEGIFSGTNSYCCYKVSPLPCCGIMICSKLPLTIPDRRYRLPS